MGLRKGRGYGLHRLGQSPRCPELGEAELVWRPRRRSHEGDQALGQATRAYPPIRCGNAPNRAGPDPELALTPCTDMHRAGFPSAHRRIVRFSRLICQSKSPGGRGVESARRSAERPGRLFALTPGAVAGLVLRAGAATARDLDIVGTRLPKSQVFSCRPREVGAGHRDPRAPFPQKRATMRKWERISPGGSTLSPARNGNSGLHLNAARSPTGAGRAAGGWHPSLRSPRAPVLGRTD